MPPVRLELAYRGLTNVRNRPEQLRMDAGHSLHNDDGPPELSDDPPKFSAAWFIDEVRRVPGLSATRRRDLTSRIWSVVRLSGLPA